VTVATLTRPVRQSLRVTVPPVEAPITLSQAKSFLSVTQADDDDMISAFIGAATGIVEDETGRKLLSQTCALSLDRFPCNGEPLSLLTGPAISITSIVSYDTLDASSTFSASSYFLDTASEPARVCLKGGYAWPTDLRPYLSAVVTFVAGWATPDDVPQWLAHAVKMRVLSLYRRLDLTVEEQRLYDWCLGPWKLHQVGD